MSEPFDVAAWYAAMRDAGQDVRAVELIEHNLQLVVLGRSYDNTRDAPRWAALTNHRDAIITFLTTRQHQEEAA
jgi:hypothetical protein